MHSSLIFLVLIFAGQAFAKDQGYRVVNGYCQKNGQPGFNQNFRGECGVLTGLVIHHQSLKEMNIRGSNLNSADLSHSAFFKSDWSHASFRRGLFSGSLFKELTARAIDLRGSSMEGARWENSDLRKWVAMGIRAEKAAFINCDLRGANFWGSNLLEASFVDSDLRGVNFDSTVLLFTNFKGAKFDSQTKLPFSREEALARGMIASE